MALADRALALNPSFARGWYISGVIELRREPDVAIEHVEANSAKSSRMATPRRAASGSHWESADGVGPGKWSSAMPEPMAVNALDREARQQPPKFVKPLQRRHVTEATGRYRAAAAFPAFIIAVSRVREPALIPRAPPQLSAARKVAAS